jgi:hypothetical protein
MMDRHAQPPSAIALPTENPGGADEPQDVEIPSTPPQSPHHGPYKRSETRSSGVQRSTPHPKV